MRTLSAIGRIGLVVFGLGIGGSKGIAGNLFEADLGSNSIYEFTSSGSPSTFTGGLSFPAGLAFSSSGTLFVANAGSNTICEITPSGIQSIFASGLSSPVGLAMDSGGDLFEADAGTNSILEFTPSGGKTTFASGLNQPRGLAFNANGILFEADAGSGHIYEFTPGGVKTTFASGLNQPRGLAFNASGILFEADAGSNNIFEFTPSGSKSKFASGLNQPWGLAMDSSGDLFEADAGSNSILEFTPAGVQTVFASGLDQPVALAFGPGPSHASWASAVSGSWSTAVNWTGGVPNGDGASAAFTVSTSASLTITLDKPETIGTLLLGCGTRSAGYTLHGSGSNTLTFSNAGNSAPAQVSVSDGTHSIDAPVVLASDLVVSSTSSNPWTLSFGAEGSITDNGSHLSLSVSAPKGTLVLSGSDDYSGGTIVSAGGLWATSNSAIAKRTSLIVGAGGTFIFDPSASASSVADGDSLAAPRGAAVAPVPEPAGWALLFAAGIIAATASSCRRVARASKDGTTKFTKFTKGKDIHPSRH